MTAKRQATSDLNHDNWDQEEEPEERGQFRQASEDQLKTRVIKKATRRVNVASADGSDGSAPKSAFSGFSGFGKTTTSASSGASPFSFLSNLSNVGSSASTSSATAQPKPTFSFGSPASSSAAKVTPTATVTQATSATTITKSDSTTGGDKSQNNNYNTKIVALNKALSEWVKMNVDKNPLCILTPIFDDYAKHLKELKEQENSSTTSTSLSSSSSTLSAAKPSTSTASESGFGSFKFTSADTAPKTTTSSLFGSSATSPPLTKSIFGNVGKPLTTTIPSDSTDKTNGFSFGLSSQPDKTPAASTAVSSSASSAPSFVFGKPSTVAGGDDKKPGGFSFAPTSTPFSFGNIKPPQPSEAAAADEEDADDEPPKVEFTQVVEEDAVYSKKCKVFVKKDGSFADRGVGTLYLKPVKDSAKAQLLVRADTNLGNILVNLVLSDGLPAQRMGKNNVMLVCLPTPDMDKPTSMLLRVKTGDEADELLTWIEKYKK